MGSTEDHATQELRNLIHTANAPIFGTDTDGVITKWNNKVAELTGFSQNETLGKHLVHNFVCPDNRASVQARFYFLFYFLYFIHLFFFHFVLHRFVCCDHFGVLSRDSVFMCWDT
jgi:PAS domain-containing protein